MSIHATWIRPLQKIQFWELHFLGNFVANLWLERDGWHVAFDDAGDHSVESVHDNLADATCYAEQQAEQAFRRIPS